MPLGIGKVVFARGVSVILSAKADQTVINTPINNRTYRFAQKFTSRPVYLVSKSSSTMKDLSSLRLCIRTSFAIFRTNSIGVVFGQGTIVCKFGMKDQNKKNEVALLPRHTTEHLAPMLP